MLEDHLRPLIRGVPPRPPSPRQLALLQDLVHPSWLDARMLTANTVDQWIRCHIDRRRATELRRLRLRRGDVVRIQEPIKVTGEIRDATHTVLSMSARGLVYVDRSGRGFRPDFMTVVKRATG